MTQVMDYVVKYTLPDVDVCPDIIKQLEERDNWESHTWYDNTEDKRSQTGDFVVKTSEEAMTHLQPAVSGALIDYARQKMGMYAQHFSNTTIRFNKYDTGQGIQPHVDHIHSIFQSRPAGIPILSLVGCLNDDYEGGQFHICDKPVDIKAGEFIIFPSVFLYTHYVSSVTKGLRYSWVSWAC